MADEYQISPRVIVKRGDAVKMHTRRGVFRFVRTTEAPGAAPLVAEVVGPIGGAELTRLVPVKDLKSAGRTPRADVSMSVEQLDLVRRAQSGRRRP